MTENFDEASLVEQEELQNPTELSETSSESESEAEYQITKSVDMNSSKVLMEATNETAIPKILKRPHQGAIVVMQNNNFDQENAVASYSIIETSETINEITEQQELTEPNLHTIDSSVNQAENAKFEINSIPTSNMIYMNSGESKHHEGTSHTPTTHSSDSPTFNFENPPKPPDESLQIVLNDLLTDDINSESFYAQLAGDTCNEQENLQQQISQLVKLTNIIAIKQLQIERKVDNILNIMVNTNADNKDIVTDQKIPVNSVEELQVLNEKLNDQSFRAGLVTIKTNSILFNVN